ncbi:MAG: FAD-dependent oxidoreductase [Myxococcales bacterium]|nr:FAD-dependent oxidoreductase [Myxococcales bacterium]
MPPPSRSLPPELRLSLGLDEPDDLDSLRHRAARRLGISPSELPDLAIRRRSIDARGGAIRFHLVLDLRPPGETRSEGPLPRDVVGERRVLIVGDGPAGLFCAYQLACAGVPCTVLDRGKKVRPRRLDLKGLQVEGRVDPESNYCFGEGGAGTYSDGKLYTRAGKRGSVRRILEILALHGAPPAILVEARPHIGSNKLPGVITAMRERLEGHGVRFEFGAKMVELLTTAQGAQRRVVGVRLEDGRELGADAVILATGHSARDVFELLGRAGVRIEPKAFALGVRIEHPQALIDRIQYGRHAGHPRLPSAAYALKAQAQDRGVFSFCMCPGGWIVPASTEPEGLVVNGMSLSRRDSPHANSGLVVSIEVQDWERHGFDGPLGGVDLQRAIEQAAASAGGGRLRAPATRVTDFAAGRASSTTPKSSYRPGLLGGDLAEVLDVTGLRISRRLREALPLFERQMRGYLSEEAVMVGVESRTSAPVRIPRDPGSLESPSCAGLYPAGEGAGYAGGIVSAAIDGMRIADALIARRFGPSAGRP